MMQQEERDKEMMEREEGRGGEPGNRREESPNRHGY